MNFHLLLNYSESLNYHNHIIRELYFSFILSFTLSPTMGWGQTYKRTCFYIFSLIQGKHSHSCMNKRSCSIRYFFLPLDLNGTSKWRKICLSIGRLNWFSLFSLAHSHRLKQSYDSGVAASVR